ncbi:MAG: DUF805 domain-containing protein [Selenomonadaceae bacterium]|nr:DUF805 domain-containing protein [Selenomonadaceae bacterium]
MPDIGGIVMHYAPDTTIKEMFWTGTSRLNRLRYLKRSLVVTFVNVLLYMILKAALDVNIESYVNIGGFDFEVVSELLWESAPEFLIISSALDIIGAVFLYKLDVRRLKDLSKDNKLAIIVFVCAVVGHVLPYVSIIGAFISVYLLLAKGVEGDNIYGPDPLEGRR